MKKLLFLGLLSVTTLVFVSCEKGEKGDMGTAGGDGDDGLPGPGTRTVTSAIINTNLADVNLNPAGQDIPVSAIDLDQMPIVMVYYHYINDGVWHPFPVMSGANDPHLSGYEVGDGFVNIKVFHGPDFTNAQLRIVVVQ